MIDSLYIGATGMHAQQMQVDTIANNLANVNTAGFKRNRIDFEDLLYRTLGAGNGVSGQAPAPTRLGMGSAIAGSTKIFTAGEHKKTDGPLDVAIRGQGFFEVALPDGSFAYTRSGAFRVNGDGVIVNQDGYALSNQVQLPPDATDIRIEPNGRISVALPNERARIDAGAIELSHFVNPSGLEPMGDNLYLATEAAGDPMRSAAGENGLGTLAQGFVENSNVQLVEELINLVLAQRAYELNSRVVQASDELLSMTNNLMR